MNSLVQLVASYFLNSLWEVAVVGGVGWVVSHLLKRLGPRIHHLWWVATLGAAVIIPALPLVGLILSNRAFPTVAQNHAFATSVFYQQPISNGFVLPPASILTLFVLFLSALMWSAARLGWSLHVTMRLRREACPVSLGPEAEELWSRCKKAFSVEEVQVLRSETIAGPVTVGFARPALLVSGGFIEECRSHDALAALAHECAHVKRRDFQKNVLYQIASVAIAFHPITWLVKSQIARTREMICDDMATERLVDRRSYAESLLRLAKRISVNARMLTSNAIGIFDANVLEERIMRMEAEKRHLGSSLKYGLGIASFVLLFSVAAGIGSVARPVAAQSKDGASGSYGKVDLSCTYYDARGRGVDGTCETHKGDKARYYCSPDYDRKLSQEQTSCEWKIGRAKQEGASGEKTRIVMAIKPPTSKPSPE
jgi:beta-lactamase regulating signal transducer with metallopeptidase domain